MRRILILALACILLSGCSGTNSASAPAQEDTTERITATSLPYPDLKYNDKVLKIKDISLYQSYSEKKYVYNPYLIIRFDRSELTDEDIHYLCDGDLAQSRYAYLHIDCNYSSESNDIKKDSMNQIIRYTDGNDLVYSFYDYEQNMAQNTFDDITIQLNIDIIQSDGKIIKMYDDCGKNYYHITINGDSEIKIEVKDESEIPKSENDMLEKGFGKIIQRGF